MKKLISPFAIIVASLALLSGVAFSAKPSQQVLSSYFVSGLSESSMKTLALEFEVLRHEGGGFEVIVDARRRSELLKIAPSALLLEANIALSAAHAARTSAEALTEGPRHRSFDEIQTLMLKWQTDYPSFVQVVEYGQSAEGRPLRALKISDNVLVDEDEPELMITGATHGDEQATPVLLLTLMEEILEGREANLRFKNIVENFEIFWIPVVNVDGFVSNQRYDSGQDPNRSYPFPDNPNKQASPAIAPLISFFHSRNILGSMDIHQQGGMIMYPWAYKAESLDAEDKKTFEALTLPMAEYNKYAVGSVWEVIYPAPGSSADYYFWQKGTLALGVEIGTRRRIPHEQLPALIAEFRESTWRFIEFFQAKN